MNIRVLKYFIFLILTLAFVQVVGYKTLGQDKLFKAVLAEQSFALVNVPQKIYLTVEYNEKKWCSPKRKLPSNNKINNYSIKLNDKCVEGNVKKILSLASHTFYDVEYTEEIEKLIAPFNLYSLVISNKYFISKVSELLVVEKPNISYYEGYESIYVWALIDWIRIRKVSNVQS